MLLPFGLSKEKYEGKAAEKKIWETIYSRNPCLLLVRENNEQNINKSQNPVMNFK